MNVYLLIKFNQMLFIMNTTTKIDISKFLYTAIMVVVYTLAVL